MVKCSDIISNVILETMKNFDQESNISQKYEKLFENLISGNSLDSDVKKMIESIKVNEE